MRSLHSALTWAGSRYAPVMMFCHVLQCQVSAMRIVAVHLRKQASRMPHAVQQRTCLILLMLSVCVASNGYAPVTSRNLCTVEMHQNSTRQQPSA